MANKNLNETNSDDLRIEYTCQECLTEVSIPIQFKTGFAAWQAGVNIQQALPNNSVDEREMLILGFCKECMDNVWNEIDQLG